MTFQIDVFLLMFFLILPLTWLWRHGWLGLPPFFRTPEEVNFRFNQARASLPRHSPMSSQVARVRAMRLTSASLRGLWFVDLIESKKTAGFC